MLPKLKKLIKKNKKIVIICVLALLALVLLVLLYKSLFYSSSERSVYGVRLRDIRENEITKDEKEDYIDKTSNIDGVKDISVNIKGKLIKVFIEFNDSVSGDDMKAKLNESLENLNEKIKGYYDIEFYVKQFKDGKTTYPIIGYKHKNKEQITFDVF